LVTQTSLALDKTMPAHAHVGQRVPITITVQNVGTHTAIDVTVRETPPGGGRIVHAADHGSIQHDGTVVWHLGNLAPGEKLTVHATMLVIQAGYHLNSAVASASNADAVEAAAAVRAPLRHAPPAPPPPAVTG
jgi:uncharacterized repeat protein (TIGR01451 family)